MKLHEIIEANASPEAAILVECLLPYKRSLNTYYSREYRGEPILMVTDVFNAAQYAKIVPANDFHDALEAYLEGSGLDAEGLEGAREVISFQSIPLSKL